MPGSAIFAAAWHPPPSSPARASLRCAGHRRRPPSPWAASHCRRCGGTNTMMRSPPARSLSGGTLGFTFPPSAGLVIYGILTEQAIGRLFLAGVVPGIILTLLFIATIWIVTTHPQGGRAFRSACVDGRAHGDARPRLQHRPRRLHHDRRHLSRPVHADRGLRLRRQLYAAGRAGAAQAELAGDEGHRPADHADHGHRVPDPDGSLCVHSVHDAVGAAGDRRPVPAQLRIWGRPEYSSSSS